MLFTLAPIAAGAQNTDPDPNADRPAVTTPVRQRTAPSDRRQHNTGIDRDTVVFSPEGARKHDRVTVVAPPVAKVDSAGMKVKVFNPDPQRALWMSALCPGLGQIYNRRYWKLPIIVGAYVGLAYGTAWNNRMLGDYTKAYRDIMDNDPTTRSYMDFYPPTVDESSIDKTWLQKALKNKKDYYRRYRDICIIAMVGVYLLNIVDAYVDASLAHFDISPDLSMRVHPEVITTQPQLGLGTNTSVGIGCSLNF